MYTYYRAEIFGRRISGRGLITTRARFNLLWMDSFSYSTRINFSFPFSFRATKIEIDDSREFFIHWRRGMM